MAVELGSGEEWLEEEGRWKNREEQTAIMCGQLQRLESSHLCYKTAKLGQNASTEMSAFKFRSGLLFH